MMLLEYDDKNECKTNDLQPFYIADLSSLKLILTKKTLYILNY